MKKPSQLIKHLTLAGALAALPLFAIGQEAKPANLQEALAQIEALRKQMNQLETYIRSQAPAGTVAPAATAATSTATSAPPADAAKAADSGFVKWNELTVGKSKFKLYGFLRLDAIYDDSRPNHPQVPSYIRSEDPTTPAAAAGTVSPRNTENLNIHPRLTRFGIDFTGPEIEMLGGAKTSGKGEIDFYNLPSSESRSAVRMRHAYLKLAWDDIFLLAGQTSDVISPIFPVVNPDFVMWGAGNLGDRRPQLRVEYAPKVGPGTVTLQGEVGLSGADDAQDLDAATFGAIRDGEASGKPTLQARAAYSQPLMEKGKLEGGVWAHKAWQRTDTAIGTALARNFDSHAFGVDLTVPLYKDIAWIKGEAWTGRNLSDVRGGILQGLNTVTGREIDAQGGWLEVGVRPVKWTSLHVGYATDNPDDSDLAGITTGARAKNSIWYGAVRGYFDPIEVGVDYLNWTTHYTNIGPGQDNRVQAYISYKF